jgi:soluble lytic murein transglycosylase
MSIRALTLVPLLAALLALPVARAAAGGEEGAVPTGAVLTGAVPTGAAQADAALAGAARSDPAELDFVAAMQRLKQHLPDLPDSTSLRSLAIYDYLVAARLRRDLAAGADADLDARMDVFLQAHAGQPVARTLRHDWLASLAQRGRWDWFLPRVLDSTDALLSCDRLQGLLATGATAALAPEALARWSLPQKQPAQCADAFAWLHQQGLITPALAVSRTRAALAADNPRLAREFAADVPAPLATDLLRWSDLIEAPRSALNVLATHPALPIDPDALAAAFDKLSRADVSAALVLLPQLETRADTTPALRSRLLRSAALGAAYDRDPRALGAFMDLPLDAIDNQVQEWRVRAALYARDFDKVRRWIEQMPPALATQPRWRYWHARAVAVNDGEEAAVPLFAEIADMRDYYGYLAADHLNRGYHLNARPSPDDVATQRALSSEPALIRAHELFDCDLSDEAASEWNSVLSDAGNALKVQAARLAARWGWYSQSIATLAQSGEFDDLHLRYPRPYADAVEQAGKLTQLSSDWILAVMRQESLFRKDAVSRADARGVMQMLPATAVAVARRWHMMPPVRDALFDPSIALPLGAAYLRELLDKYSGNLSLALAAYNAGPAAVERWLPPRSMEAAIWIENIPYNETRGYVQHIVEHIVAFAYVAGNDPPRLAALLPVLDVPVAAL